MIEESVNVKYLCQIICNDISDDDDMMMQRRQLYAQGNVISRRFHMCSIDVKNMLFRTFCTPMYTRASYGGQSWHRLRMALNNAYRILHQLPTYCSASQMFTDNSVPNCQAVIRNLTYRFMIRLNESNHLFVRAILSSDLLYTSRIRRPWMRSLYIHFDNG